MRLFLILVIFLFLGVFSSCSQQTVAMDSYHLNYKSINFNNESGLDKLETFIDDFKYISEDISVTINDKLLNNAINIFHIDAFKLNTEIKNQLREDEQSFYIEANKNRVILVCTGIDSYQNAFYSLLHLFGIRFLSYSDNGVYKPHQLRSLYFEGQVMKRKISNAYYSETYGLDEPTLSLRKRFQDRNFYTSNTGTTSHFMQIFYQENKDIVLEIEEKSPDNPIVWNKKYFNLDNELTLDLLKDWILTKVDHPKYAKGVSVSPADGLGDGEETKYNPSSYPEIENLHEVNWYIAIELANHIKKERPNYEGTIAYAAYGDGKVNVQPPKWRIPENMFVQLIFGFQTYYMSEKQMYDEWNEKAKNDGFKIGVHTHLNITQSNKNGLTTSTLKNNYDKLSELWFDSSYNFLKFKYETTGFSLTVLPFIYSMSQLNQSWNTKSPPEIWKEWFFLSYGAGDEGVQKALSTNLSKQTLPYIFQLLNSAKTKIENSNSFDQDSQLLRLKEVYIYFKYMELYFNETSEDNYEDIINYVTKYSDLGIFQLRSIIRKPEVGSLRPSENKNLKEIEYVENKDFVKEFSLVEFPTLSESASDLLFMLVDFDFDRDKINYNSIIEGYSYKPQSIGKDQFYVYYPTDTVFQIRTEPIKENATISILGSDNSVKELKVNSSSTENIKIEGGVMYTMTFSKDFLKIDLPKNILFQIKYHYRITSDFKYYFYIPSSAEELIYMPYDNTTNNKNNYVYAIDENGEKVSLGEPIKLPEKLKSGHHYFKYVIPSKYRGSTFTGNFIHHKFDFLNIPRIHSKQYFEYNEVVNE